MVSDGDAATWCRKAPTKLKIWPISEAEAEKGTVADLTQDGRRRGG